MKVCSRCNAEKNKNEFIKRSHNRDGFGAWCKQCARDHAKEKHTINKEMNNARSQKWKLNNPDKVKEYSKKWYLARIEERRNYAKQYAKENKEKIEEYRNKTKEQKAVKAKIYRIENKDRIKITSMAWAANNKERKCIALKKWRQVNPEKNNAAMQRSNIKRGESIKYRISGSVSRRIRTSLYNNNSKAGCHWENLVGFTLSELMFHLSSLFTAEMSWNNYGSYWEIDHKIPINAFNFKTTDDVGFKYCWSLENLQPLEKIANRSKGAKVDKDVYERLFLVVGGN